MTKKISFFIFSILSITQISHNSSIIIRTATPQISAMTTRAFTALAMPVIASSIMKYSSYSGFGLPQNASKEQIQNKYKQLAMKHHPDQGGNENDFKKLQHDYKELLKNTLHSSQQSSTDQNNNYNTNYSTENRSNSSTIKPYSEHKTKLNITIVSPSGKQWGLDDVLNGRPIPEGFAEEIRAAEAKTNNSLKSRKNSSFFKLFNK